MQSVRIYFKFLNVIIKNLVHSIFLSSQYCTDNKLEIVILVLRLRVNKFKNSTYCAVCKNYSSTTVLVKSYIYLFHLQLV